MTRSRKRWRLYGVVIAALISAVALVCPIYANRSYLSDVPWTELDCNSVLQSFTYPVSPTRDNYAPWLVFDDYGPTKKADVPMEESCRTNFSIATGVSGAAGIGAVVLAILELIALSRSASSVSQATTESTRKHSVRAAG